MLTASPDSTRPPRRLVLHRTIVGLVAAAALIAAVAGGPSAGAQTIGDLEEEASALDLELHEARERIEELAEEYSQAQVKVSEAEDEIAAARSALVATEATMAARQADLRTYAVRAYVDGGGLHEVDRVLTSEFDGAERRLAYIETAIGSRKALIDELKVAKQDVDQRLRQVADAEGRAKEWVARTEAARQEAQAIERNLNDRLAATTGRLAEAVSVAEAEREAAEQAAAEEAARQAGLSVALEPAASVVRESATVAPPVNRPIAPVVQAPRPEATIAVQAALSQLGVPYVWAGSSPDQGFDCSGLMYWAWGQAGRSIPRPADYQRDDAIPISYEDLQPGDLVFYGEPPSHVAMYIGGDQIVDAPQTGEYVEIKTMWYSRKPMSYGRVA